MLIFLAYLAGFGVLASLHQLQQLVPFLLEFVPMIDTCHILALEIMRHDLAHVIRG
jgi:hypothetical protein